MIIRIHENSLLFIFIKIAYLKLECGELDKCQYCVGEESFFFLIKLWPFPCPKFNGSKSWQNTQCEFWITTSYSTGGRGGRKIACPC